MYLYHFNFVCLVYERLVISLMFDQIIKALPQVTHGFTVRTSRSLRVRKRTIIEIDLFEHVRLHAIGYQSNEYFLHILAVGYCSWHVQPRLVI